MTQRAVVINKVIHSASDCDGFQFYLKIRNTLMVGLVNELHVQKFASQNDGLVVDDTLYGFKEFTTDTGMPIFFFATRDFKTTSLV